MLKELLLDIFLPKFCVGCGREGLYICKSCEILLSEVDPFISTCEVNATTSQVNGKVGLPDIVSVWEYEGLMEKLIQKIKFDGCFHIIDELVEKALEKVELNLPEDIVITFVPMRLKKEKQRGFNRAELIAKKVGEETGRLVVKFLEKIKDNRSQVGLNPQERIENVKDVFRVVPLMEVRPHSILLVDDVYTTGATMNECKKVLKKAGVKNVWGFTLSRKMNIQNC